MTSQLKQALRDLKTKILTIQLNGAPAFLYTAVNNDQVKMEATGQTYDFPKPAVLIEIANPRRDLEGAGAFPMKGVECLGGMATVSEHMVFRFSIVHEQLNAMTDGTANYGMDEDLDVYDYRDALKRAMTGFMPTNCSRLMYHEESQDYHHNNIYVYGLSMICSFVDTKGSYLDVDSGAIYAQPPFNLDLDTYFITPAGPVTHQAYGWKPCSIIINVVETPNSSTQTLANGDVVPLQYALNDDGTLTIPELASYPGIALLTPFMLYNNGYQLAKIGYDNTTGTFDFSYYGGFAVGNNIEINAVLPIYTI